MSEVLAITSSASVTATEDIRFEYYTQANDIDGEVLTYSFTNLPGWLTAAADSIIVTRKHNIKCPTFIFTSHINI